MWIKKPNRKKNIISLGSLKFYFERGYRFIGLAGWCMIIFEKVHELYPNTPLFYLIFSVPIALVFSIVIGYVDVRWGTFKEEQKRNFAPIKDVIK